MKSVTKKKKQLCLKEAYFETLSKIVGQKRASIILLEAAALRKYSQDKGFRKKKFCLKKIS